MMFWGQIRLMVATAALTACCYHVFFFYFLNNVDNPNRLILRASSTAEEFTLPSTIVNNDATIRAAGDDDYSSEARSSGSEEEGDGNDEDSQHVGFILGSDPLVSFVERERRNRSRPCDGPGFRRPKTFVIKAERHHGSNLMQLIIMRHTRLRNGNKKGEDIQRGKAGRRLEYNWKHGYLNPAAVPPPSDTFLSSAMLIITRDVFHWLPRMYQQPYSQREEGNNLRRKMTFSEYIRAPYVEVCATHVFNGDEPCAEPFEVADNLIRSRTLKYKNWLYVDPRWFGRAESYLYSHRTHMRYESIIERGQEAALDTFLSEHCVRRKHKKKAGFQPAVMRVSHGGEEMARGVVFVPETDEEVLGKYTEEDIRFVLGELDREFERRILNYTYDYAEEYLRRAYASGGEKLDTLE